MARVEVITGPERRRRWNDEQKRAIVAASLEPGAIVADVARRAEVGADRGSVSGVDHQGTGAAMIPVPSGVRVWLAVGHTDMRAA